MDSLALRVRGRHSPTSSDRQYGAETLHRPSAVDAEFFSQLLDGRVIAQEHGKGLQFTRTEGL